ncbi:hypothetical protein BD410DRAFT_782556 [Rickenella mellea]|uniref:Uncharacterized protein n=1 Tax=Rickenella mellea TaxID=50990 RepID=A0A4Y7QK76_9AGAM|nr:hypothetical protein BD410DRAFT_782556 [Rickenella mellea]
MPNASKSKIPPGSVQSKSRATTPQSDIRSFKQKRLSISDPQSSQLEEDDYVAMDVDIESFGDSAGQPLQSSSTKPPLQDVSVSRGESHSKRKPKKKNVVYSDDDVGRIKSPGYDAAVDESDDEFMPESPPDRSVKLGKHSIGAVKTKAKRHGGKGRGSAADEGINARKMSRTDVSSNKSTRTKRPLTENEGDVLDEAPESKVDRLTSETTPLNDGDPPPEEPAQKKRKLPTIKKNKNLAATAVSSGTSTPVNPSSSRPLTAPAGVDPTVKSLLNPNNSLPRKPAASLGGADIDLSNSDIYNSLFKSGGGHTPKSGLNRREKEEERRKELDQMRDEARAARLSSLQRTSFDLLAGQEKVARFEAKLKERNSVALFPAHLCSYLKHKKF